jgi:hypothetical protein
MARGLSENATRAEMELLLHPWHLILSVAIARYGH